MEFEYLFIISGKLEMKYINKKNIFVRSVLLGLTFFFSVVLFSFAQVYGEENKALYQAGESFKDCEQCPEMIVIPKGSFMMGDIQGVGDPDEQYIHKVTFENDFAIGKFEITWNEWEICMADGACPEVKVGDDSIWGEEKRPVIHAFHKEAFMYVKWLSDKTGKNYRLLSEAEFEYVARAGTQTKFYWGNEIGVDHANCTDCLSNFKRGTDPVGTFVPNQFGVYEILGNLWEVIEDCYHDTYEGAPTDGTARIDGDCKSRVIRGGGWHDDAWNMRAANRRISDASDLNALNGTGMRVAVSDLNKQ
jgi:formylglycine-generating enzyme required for sulfatase activity